MQISTQGQPLGRVLSVTGSQAQVRLSVDGDDARATVGKFLGIRADGALVVGVITKIAAEKRAPRRATASSRPASSTCSARSRTTARPTSSAA